MCSSLSKLIDCDTPQSMYTRVGHDGRDYKLVFSDEFNQEGRTFEEGADPFWTAADMHYWATNDLEYYDPSSITTREGYLSIELIEAPDPDANHGFKYMSGMLTSWNKFCFTGGIVEASVSLPGANDVAGFWPAFWTMGNLARPSYGATTEGTWPYSYGSCDSGTTANQTNVKTGKMPMVGAGDNKGQLSKLPGQKLSACTCAGEDDHPGPSNKVGRGAPEMDILEASISKKGKGEIGQALQIAPFDDNYDWDNTTANYLLGDGFDTRFNDKFRGGFYQQCMSAVSDSDQMSYELADESAFQTYGLEYAPSYGKNSDGYITWTQDDKTTFHLHETALSGDKDMDIGQRLVSREPMQIIMNLAISETWSEIDSEKLVFPATLRFDWVRVYQPVGYENVGCDPPDFPTEKYIQKHVKAYTDPKLKQWKEHNPKGFPKNSLVDKC